MKKLTEQDSHYRHLEKMDSLALLTHINNEDNKVPLAVAKCIPQIDALVQKLVELIKNGGRLFYIGAGTSGRLGILDASECPPTFGVSHDLVIGLIAGGDSAIRKAVEFAEDDVDQAIKDLQHFGVDTQDMVVGIAASGTTPYVVGGLSACRQMGIPTGCITCNTDAPIIAHADFPVVCTVGPEFVTGSTRMKAGTAQKLILNMITTATMIKLGRVKDNKMVDMQLSNDKLVDRGTRMIMEQSALNYEAARALLLRSGSVRIALDKLNA
jgi:N-acetylmuramic acid 6-phosphate etherase